ncbi:hypothetical protein [Ralstonia sp. ASV6]|uniref:hypothetical protein n=1 Tax=Ralstonia sp. ASV6 TaxID=2795124 RepID=UPI0018ED9ED5|nr:hypothetical protein [Ralstonia sp. ASV6]
MAAVLGWNWGALRSGVDRWVRGGLTLSLAFLLMAGTAHAQKVATTGCTMPGQMCIQGNSMGVDVSVRQSGNGVPQTPSAGVMSVLVPITIGVAAVGAAAVAIPATGAIAIAGDAIAAAGMAAIRSRVIQGAALMTLIGMIPSSNGLGIDSNGNVVAPAVSANAGDVGFSGYQWYGVGGFSDSAAAACAAGAAPNHATLNSVQVSGSSAYCAGTWNWPERPDLNGGSMGYGVYQVGSCVSGYVSSGSGCVPDPNAAKQPASDAQVKSALAATPATWPSIYNDMNCGPTLALTNGSTSDPCYALYSDSRTGFGVSFSTGGSSWTNNGCAVNSTSCPSATVTTAPTTDSSTKVNADGSKTTTTNTTTKTTTVTGTNDRTNPVEGQTTTTTTTSTTVTNPDGSTTTTTTTTTDQAPPATAGNPANQNQQDKPQPTTATFNGTSASLYTKKDKTFGQVLQAFVSRVQAMPWYTASVGFFTVSISGGSCPHWSVPATRWSGPLDMTPYVCGSSMATFYSLAGTVVLIVAAWAAFRIAFL